MGFLLTLAVHGIFLSLSPLPSSADLGSDLFFLRVSFTPSPFRDSSCIVMDEGAEYLSFSNPLFFFLRGISFS